MDAGALDQRILIEVASVTDNELGEEVDTWSEHSRPWANVKETPGREFLAGDIKAETKAVFRIRYRAIDSRARVTWAGRQFEVDDVTGTRREGWTWLHCYSVSGENR